MLLLALLILAQTPAPPEGHMSTSTVLAILGWVTTFTVAIIGAFRAKTQHAKGYEEGKAQSMRIEAPVPEIPMRRVLTPPSFDQHSALSRRVDTLEREVGELRRDQGQQFKQLIEAGTEREARIMETIRTSFSEVTQRVDQLMNRKPTR